MRARRADVNRLRTAVIELPCGYSADEKATPMTPRPRAPHWIELLTLTGQHWNILLDLIAQSLPDLDNPDPLRSKAIITNHKQSFFFAEQKDVHALIQASE